MAIIDPSPYSDLERHFSNAAERVNTGLKENRQKQQNIEQSGFLGQLLQGIASKGDDAGFADIMGMIHGDKNISSENKQNLSKQFGEHYSKKEIENSKRKGISGKSLSPESRERINHAFNRTNELLKSGKTGFTYKGLGEKGREDRAELNNLSEIWISELIPLLNPKGTISKDRFNYIKGLAPNSTDTDATIKGKLKALKYIFKESGMGEDGQIPGSPEGFRSQNEKPQGDMVYVKHPKTGEPFPVPRAEFEANKEKHPELLEVQNQ